MSEDSKIIEARDELQRIVDAGGCRNRYEMPRFLNMSEKVLKDALICYSAKYGQRIETDDYDLYFEPCLMVVMKCR